MEHYPPRFFSRIQASARTSAEHVVPTLLNLLTPESVIDVGCGTGEWLSIFRAHGVENIAGLDGDYVQQSALAIPATCFSPQDLSQPFALERRFDLAISLEVAEHLPPASAEGFVASLVKLAPIIVFSAAVPGQWGNNHINCQWPRYWIDHFSTHGYQVADCLRATFWPDWEIAWWYRQNILLFLTPDALERQPMIQASLSEHNLYGMPLVHPENFLTVQRKMEMVLNEPRLKGGLRSFRIGLRNSVKDRLTRR